MNKFEDSVEEALDAGIQKTEARWGIFITEDPESGDIVVVNKGIDEESSEFSTLICDALWRSYEEFVKKECMH